MFAMSDTEQKALRSEVRRLVSGRFRAKAEFARAASIDQSNLTKWLNGAWSFGAESLARIAAAASKMKGRA